MTNRRSNVASAVPSQQTGVRASSNHEAIRMSFFRTQRIIIHVIIES